MHIFGGYLFPVFTVITVNTVTTATAVTGITTIPNVLTNPNDISVTNILISTVPFVIW